VGFYADRKDNRYNGIAYFDVDPNTLDIRSQKYNPLLTTVLWTTSLAVRKIRTSKNLVFKGVEITDEQEIFFNAEEYFVTTGLENHRCRTTH
jgi:hypothetical protein